MEPSRVGSDYLFPYLKVTNYSSLYTIIAIVDLHGI